MEPLPTTAPIVPTNPAVPAAPAMAQPPVTPPLNATANKKSLYLIIGIIILVLIMVVLSLLLLLRRGSAPLASNQVTIPQSTQNSPRITASQAPSPTPLSTSATQEAEQIDTGDPTGDITLLQSDASAL